MFGSNGLKYTLLCKWCTYLQ